MKYLVIIIISWIILSFAGACTTALPSPGSPAAVKVKLKTEALLINGGGEKAINYGSHLVHLRRLTELLRESGVSRDNITIFASDGQDESPDLAVRGQGAFEDYWLIGDTYLDEILGPPLRYENSAVEGMRLLPAKKAALESYFHLKASKLEKGDTLLVYVTDHGERGKGENPEASISLWGEDLTVSELIVWLDSLDPEVRVVLWMSQCYSGAFDRAVYAVGDVLRRNACGFYSAPADRPAWGCYPEAETEEGGGEGHSMRFLDALAQGSRFAEAHERVLLSDKTPDVPNRSSDHYLARLVELEADKRKMEVPELADLLLDKAWQSDSAFADERKIVEKLADRAGIPPPKQLSDLKGKKKKIGEHQKRSETDEERWQDVLTEAKREQIRRFAAENQEWRARKFAGLLRAHKTTSEDVKDREAVRVELLEKLITEFRGYLAEKPEALERLQAFRDRQRSAAEIAARMQARKAAVSRLRTLLVSMAGEILARGNPDLEAGLTRLRQCEAWGVPGGPVRSGSTEDALEKASTGFPTLEEDLARLEELRPAWLGVHYLSEHAEVRERFGLSPGAVVVSHVIEGSAAHDAGVRRGDTIFGAGAEEFDDRGDLKARVMVSRVGETLELQVLRDEEKMTIPVPLKPYPKNVPKARPALRLGEPAPSLGGLRAFEGRVPSERSPVLLAFFATWCGPCKLAMGDLVEWEKKHGIPVMLVSGEEEEAMSKWVAKWKKPRPSRIALDPRGLVMDAYQAKSYPTFIIVDGEGRIQKIKKGYGKNASLPTP